MNDQLTAYCGLCCVDCIPSREEFFRLIDKMDAMLADMQFEKYAELKAETEEIFQAYPTFLSVLHHIRDLRCPKPCRQGGGKPDCAIRQCAKNKGLPGCWACDIRRPCEKLDRLRDIHPHLDYHLDLIRDLGPDAWLEKRKEHYRWQVDKK